MYLLSLRAATWTDLVSQARKAPNSWNVSIKKIQDLLLTLTTTVYFQTSFIFIVFWAHNLRPEHKSENRRLLRGNRTTSRLINICHKTYSYSLYLYEVGYAEVSNQPTIFIWIFKAKCKPSINAHADITKNKNLKFVLYRQRLNYNIVIHHLKMNKGPVNYRDKALVLKLIKMKIQT